MKPETQKAKQGRHMATLFTRFLKDESGATAIEYGLIAALISVAIITAFGTVGDKISSAFTKVDAEPAEVNK
jgi:pilus assembly protein Flp/PilA